MALVRGLSRAFIASTGVVLHMAKGKTKPSKSKQPQASAANRKTAAPADKMSVARKIAWGCILAVVFITPIAISNLTFLNSIGFSIQLPLTYDQFDIIKVFIQRVLTLVALAAWSWDMLTRGGKLRRTPVDWLVLAFLGWVTLSTVFSMHPPTAVFGKYRRFEGLLSFINYATLYFLVIQFADRPSRIKQLAQSLFASGIIVGLYGAMQSVGIDPLSWGRLPFEANRSFSTYGNPDLLGGFLMFSVFVSLGLALAEKHLAWRAVYWFGFLLNTYVVITAFTRSAWVGAFAGFILIAIVAFRQRVEWKIEDWVFAGAAAVAVVGAIVRSLSNPNAVMNFSKRVVSIFEFDQGSAKTRFQIWEAAWEAVKDSPIVGFGPDTFRLLFPGYKPIEYVRDAGYLSVADNVHNYPLQLASGIGIPGVLLLYGIFGWAAWRSAPLVFGRNDAGGSRMVLGGFWVACAAYIVHLLFGLSVTGSSFLLWVSMAAVLAPTAVSHDFSPPKWGIFPAALIVALASFGVGFWVVYLQADNAYLMARIGSTGSERIRYAERAVELNPYNDMYRAEVGLAYTDETVAHINQALTATQSGGDAGASIQAAERTFRLAEAKIKEAIEFVPAEYDNYVFLTNLYNLAGQFFDERYYQDAIVTAEQGIEVSEFGPAIRYQYARALHGSGQVDRAIGELEYAHSMDPAYSEAALLAASYHEEQGDIASALEILRATETYRPGLPDVAEEIARLEAATDTVSP